MDENEIFSRVKDVIAEQLGIDDLDTITSETTFIDDLGADSLDVVELIMAFEEEFDMEIPEVEAEKISTVGDVVDYIKENVDKSAVRCINKDVEKEIIKEIDKVKSEGDTLGGVVEIRVKNLIPGLGSYTQFDKKIDGELAMHLMSIQAIKGVEIGIGFDVANNYGSNVMDEIYYNNEDGIKRKTNQLGGIEGGMTNGEPLVVTAIMKPIPTLRKPLNTVDAKTMEQTEAHFERSDTCAVEACSVVAENRIACVLIDEILMKFGGDNLNEVLRT